MTYSYYQNPVYKFYHGCPQKGTREFLIWKHFALQGKISFIEHEGNKWLVKFDDDKSPVQEFNDKEISEILKKSKVITKISNVV